jgi:hypothetical protein
MRQRPMSARDMQNGVDVLPVQTRNEAACIRSGGGDEFHAPAISLLPELRRDRKRTVSPCADDQLAPAPRDVLVGRQRSVAIDSAVGFEGFLIRLRTSPRSMTTSCS